MLFRPIIKLQNTSKTLGNASCIAFIRFPQNVIDNRCFVILPSRYETETKMKQSYLSYVFMLRLLLFVLARCRSDAFRYSGIFFSLVKCKFIGECDSKMIFK